MKALHAALIGLMAFTMSCRTEEPTAPAVQGARSGSGGPTVSSVVPDSSGRATSLDITVNGSGFDQGSEVTLEREGVPASGIATNATTFVSRRKLVANITIAADADTGKYDVAVMTTGGRKGVGIEMFNVLYELVEVGVIGGTWSIGAAINDLGHVVGTSCTTDCLSHAFFWSEAGGLEDLGTLAGNTRSAAYSINNHGQVLGSVACPYTDPGCASTSTAEAVLWTRSGGQWSATLLGIPLPRWAAFEDGSTEGDINDSGQFVLLGGPIVYSLSGGTAVGEALPPLGAGGNVFAYAINDAGVVVGSSLPNDGTSQAVLWFRDQSGTWRILRLGELPGHDMGRPRDISEVDAAGRIHVVGFTALSGSRSGEPVRWTLESDGAGGWSVTALEALPVPPNAMGPIEARGVNSGAEAVGEFRSGGAPHAAKWPPSGAMEKLPSPNAGMTRAKDINDGGLIVGSVWDNLRDCERAAVWRLR